MRYFFIGLLLVISTVVKAADYFVSSSGNDSNSGLSISLPWKTITKVNSVFPALQPGDRILFKRGETFYGSLNITRSGMAGSPITIGAYGSGDKPVITGFTTVSGWTNEGNGIYSASITSEAQTNMVLIDGVNYGMGRWPDNGYNIFEDATTNISITDFELGTAIDWTLAEVVIRKNDWTLDRCRITDHAGNKLTYMSLGTQQEAYIKHGYFIQNDLRTLSALGEWYHNINSGKIYIYFGAVNPASRKIEVATINNIIYNNGNKFITVDNLKLSGSISHAVYYPTYISNDCIIQNSIIRFAGQDGIQLLGQRGTIKNNVISDCNRTGIRATGDYLNLTYNQITNIGIVPGLATEGSLTSGIMIEKNGSLVQFNTIENVGHCGIGLSSTVSIITIKNNYINNVMLLLNDGGGIYITNEGESRIIEGNIVLNVKGNTSGTPYPTRYIARGIYLDSHATNVFIKNNTVAHCTEGGYMIHRAHENKLEYNTSFNNGYAMFLQNTSGSDIRNIEIKNNIFYAKAPSQLALKFYSVTDDILLFGSADNNHYARPVDDHNVFHTNSPLTGPKYRTLEGWQDFTSQDLNSEKSPVVLTDTADIDFYYNASTSNKVISLSKSMIDIKGTKYTGSITLLPYTSVILKPYPDTAIISAKTSGNTEIYSLTTKIANRRAQIISFTEAGTIESISIYHNGGSGQVLLGVYSDASGSPATRLGVTSSTTVSPSAGWQTITLTSPVSVNSGQKVWLSWVFENNPGIRYIDGAPARAEAGAFWSGGMPATFGTAGFANYKYSIYCTYTTGALPAKTSGNTELYSLTTKIANRRAQVISFTEAGTIESISIYHNGGSGQVLLGVYSDSNGSPAARLGVTSSTTVSPSAGWQKISLTSPVTVNSGQKVWLSWVFENNPGIRYIDGTPARAESGTFWSQGMPSTFGTAGFANYKYSIYCTYTTEVIPAKLSGNTEVYSLTTKIANRRAQVISFTEAGTIESISIYHNGGSGQVLLGVYSDASGYPATRLGVTSATTVSPSAGWQTISLTSPVQVIAGQKVWLSWVFENNPGVRYIDGTPARAESTALWSGGMPSTFGAAGFANYKYSIYCTYITASANASIDQMSVDLVDLNKEADAVKTDPGEISYNRILIYPNPTTGSVTLSMEKSYENELVLTIYDLQGRLIKTVQVGPANYNVDVDLQDRKNGTYLFMLRDIKNGMLLNRAKIIKYR